MNFHSPDDNLIIKGGCDLFTTKPIGSDRKLFKTIDKHLDQILEDNHLSHSLDQERKSSFSTWGFSTSPRSRSRHGSFGQSDSVLNRRQSTSLNTSDSRSSQPTITNAESSSSLTHLDDSLTFDKSPFGSLKEISTRKTFAYLIAILNTTYPDHDFSNLQPTTDNFHRLESSEDLITRFNNLMMSLGKKEELLTWIWDIINDYMDVNTTRQPSAPTTGSFGSRKRSFSSLAASPTNADHGQSPEPACKIYEFQPSDQSLLEDLNHPYQTMWSNYWFIYNKKKKRVCFLYLNAINRIHFAQVNGAQGSFLEQELKDDSENNKALSRASSEFVYNEDLNTDVIGDMEI